MRRNAECGAPEEEDVRVLSKHNKNEARHKDRTTTLENTKYTNTEDADGGKNAGETQESLTCYEMNVLWMAYAVL